MATTLKAVVNKDRRRRDGTYTVRIRLTKDRSTVYLDTPFATQTPDIREKDVRAAAEKYIAQLREKIAALGTEAIHITASELKSRLNNNVKTDVKQRLADRAERQEREGKPACAANTRCTLNRLAEYHANPLDYTEVTPQLLRGAERYKSPQEFNRAVNKGLERLCAKLQIPKLTYYAARHTWATVAHNECDVPEDVIAQALAHTPSTVTSLYINRDRRAVDKANDKVLKTLFGKKQIFR